MADVRLYREGLRQALADHGAVSVAGVTPVSQSGLELTFRERPDVVLLEARAAACFPVLASLVATLPELKVVAYGVTDDGDDAVCFAEAGVSGYVSREATIDELIHVVSRVVAGEFPCSPRIVARMARRMSSLAAGHPAGRPTASLTGREREVLRLIDEGLSNKEIAKRLGIELSTVKNHVHHILEKTRAARRSQAAARLRPTHPGTITAPGMDLRIQAALGHSV